MKRLLNDIRAFWQCKIYVAGLALAAVCSYGYIVTHYAIGMDDTAVPLYFDEGLAPYVGRWSMFALNKIFHVTSFAPWIVETFSVILLMLSVTLWCVLWRRMCEPIVKLPMWCYTFIAGIFMSCPLISEVYVFYLHNGICIGYGVAALALICFTESLSVGKTKKYRAGRFLLSILLLAFSLGFYESFLIVFVMGAVMCFFLLRRFYGRTGEETEYSLKFLFWAGGGVLAVLAGMAFHGGMSVILKTVCRLEKFSCYNVLYRKMFGDIFTVRGELRMLLERFYAKYFVNAVVYLPITVFVAAWVFIGIYALYFGIRKRDILLPVCVGVLAVLPVLMSVVEGLATRYRSAQYVPVVGAFAVLLAAVEIALHKVPKWVSLTAVLLGGVIALPAVCGSVSVVSAGLSEISGCGRSYGENCR